MSAKPVVTLLVGMNASTKWMPVVVPMRDAKHPNAPDEANVTLSDGLCLVTAHMTLEQLAALVLQSVVILRDRPGFDPDTLLRVCYNGPGATLADGETVAVKE